MVETSISFRHSSRYMNVHIYRFEIEVANLVLILRADTSYRYWGIYGLPVQRSLPRPSIARPKVAASTVQCPQGNSKSRRRSLPWGHQCLFIYARVYFYKGDTTRRSVPSPELLLFCFVIPYKRAKITFMPYTRCKKTCFFSKVTIFS